MMRMMKIIGASRLTLRRSFPLGNLFSYNSFGTKKKDLQNQQQSERNKEQEMKKQQEKAREKYCKYRWIIDTEPGCWKYNSFQVTDEQFQEQKEQKFNQLKKYLKIFSKNPQNYQAYFYIGKNFYASNNLFETMICLKRFIDNVPYKITSDSYYELRKQYTNALKYLGASLFEAQRYEDAIPYFQKIIEIQEEDNLAEAFVKICYSRLIQEQSSRGYQVCYEELAHHYFLQKKYSLAAYCYYIYLNRVGFRIYNGRQCRRLSGMLLFQNRGYNNNLNFAMELTKIADQIDKDYNKLMLNQVQLYTKYQMYTQILNKYDPKFYVKMRSQQKKDFQTLEKKTLNSNEQTELIKKSFKKLIQEYFFNEAEYGFQIMELKQTEFDDKQKMQFLSAWVRHYQEANPRKK